MKTIDYLMEYITIADKHVLILEEALKRVEFLLPFNANKLKNGNYDEITIVDIINFRFSKLQDLIGSKIFPIILTTLGEDHPEQSFVDKLNTLEKLGYLKNAYEWRDLRDIRNDIAHEYGVDSEKLAKKINEVIDDSVFLLAYWKELKQKLEQIKSQLM